jgi:hypothetical protein
MTHEIESSSDIAPIGIERGWFSLGGGEADLLRQLCRGEWHAVKARNDRAAYHVETPAGSFFAKHYTPVGWWGRIGDFLLQRRPQRAFVYGRKLGELGVNTPKPLGLFVRGRWLPREALLVTRWLGRPTKWSHHLIGEVPGTRFPEAYRHALVELARLLARLHRERLYHGDLSANLVFAGVDGRQKPYLIDLEALSRRLSRKRRVKNLEELGRGARDLKAVPLRDRWMFLAEYATAAGLDLHEARRLWREGRAAQIRRGVRAVNRSSG